MVRKLKFHEQKLLKKVDFISWEETNNVHEAKIMKRFHIQKRDEYATYKKLSRETRELVRKIQELEQNDPFRIESSSQVLEKLHMLGLIHTRDSLEHCNKVTASSFCKRRLPVVMVKSKMAENLKLATKLVQQGHVRVGTEVVKDPAFLVSKNLEDFVTWVDTSAIRKHVMEYNGMRDDFDLYG
ncbi:U3 small nucleolar ribonucleoprotein protein IMP3 [Cloeon dipterum]|uniref:U3 small nucleolar ribonucleoprotein protein IMP3 n=1 Tax=Cloeon dipterum TaxID=197152 RepID=UPI0032201EBE